MALGWIMGGKIRMKRISDPEPFRLQHRKLYHAIYQQFFGPAGVVVTSLFDTGNAVIALGGSYSIGAMVKTGKRNFHLSHCAKHFSVLFL